jgi:ABC-type glycerol-3-phosphate transport system permease component
MSRHRVFNQLLNVLLVGVIAVFGAPFLWIGAMAFDAHSGSLTPWPKDPTMANVRTLFHDLAIGQSLRNSVVVATSTMVLATLAAAMAGYGLSRISWRRKTLVAYGLLLLQTIPLSATMVPVYDLTRRLGLQETYRGVILGHTALALPLLVWLMKGSFDAIPPSLQEAAELDGCSVARAWLGVLLPVVRPGVAVTAGLAFLTSWSEALMVFVVVHGEKMQTVALRFMTVAQSGGAASTTAALGMLYIVPVLVLFLVFRTQFVRGLATTGQIG